MKNSYEALFGFGGKKKDEEEKSVPSGSASGEKPVEKKEETELEKATNIKKEISEITQGRNLEDLSQDDLNAVLAKYREMEIALGLPETEPK